jgi:SAM-dependent methyltransferase
MAQETGATCIGVDINEHGIAAATRRASEADLAAQVSFRTADASQPFPFPDASFDAVFCNDSINHFPDRLAVLRDWYRLLRPGGRLLFTDPIVVTGQLTSEEIRSRSSIGFFLFTPVGCNERMLAQSGFTVDDVWDVTDAVASVSKRWRDARATLRDSLVRLEGEDSFEGLQRFLDAVHTLASERRLSRCMYLAAKPSTRDA